MQTSFSHGFPNMVVCLKTQISQLECSCRPRCWRIQLKVKQKKCNQQISVDLLTFSTFLFKIVVFVPLIVTAATFLSRHSFFKVPMIGRSIFTWPRTRNLQHQAGLTSGSIDVAAAEEGESSCHSGSNLPIRPRGRIPECAEFHFISRALIWQRSLPQRSLKAWAWEDSNRLSQKQMYRPHRICSHQPFFEAEWLAWCQPGTALKSLWTGAKTIYHLLSSSFLHPPRKEKQ